MGREGYKLYLHRKNNRAYYHRTRTQQYKDDPLTYLWAVAKKRAKKFSIPFDIEVSDIKMEPYCPITGVELDVLTNKSSTGMSLDRVDNTKGYVKGNVAIISRKANRLKGDGTINDFRKIIQYMESF